MTDFLIFCMATVGLTAILVDGKIFQPLRERLENRVRKQERRQKKNGEDSGNIRRTWSAFFLGIITCYQCCGFWSGLFCGLFFTANRCTVETSPVFVIGSRPIMAMFPATFLQFIFAAFLLFLCGLVGSFLATVYLMLVELIFAKTMLCRRTNPELPPEEEHSDDEPA